MKHLLDNSKLSLYSNIDKISESKAKYLIEEKGCKIKSIKKIPEGSNHYSFDVILEDGTPLIGKFKKNKNNLRDSLFGGIISLERECAIYSLIGEKTGLPTPKLYGKYKDGGIYFILVEKLPGKLWSDYIRENNYSISCFLKSLEYLGQDIARLQKVTFETFGDLMNEYLVLPKGIINFADRFIGITKMRLKRVKEKNILDTKKVHLVKKYFFQQISEIREYLYNYKSKPTLVFTDMHSRNFLVNDFGKPSGYFDLESCQAAHPALEFYGLKFFLFNYFNYETFKKAEDSFFKGYKKEGGEYDQGDYINKKLEDLLAINRIMELSESYHEIKDGLRDKWSIKFKELLFEAIETNSVNYSKIADIIRAKDGQPKNPG